MAKMAKVPQTDWTRGGHDISQTAIPLYQTNLTRMGNYLEDPMAHQQKYIDKYFGPDAIQNQDLLRQYNRAMGNATGNNYAATAGGLASSAQRAYNDQQRYYNDWVARLQGENVTNAYNMSNQDYQNMLSANQSYKDAYSLGENYSKTQQQNYLADKANGNWLGQGMSSVGKVMSAIPTPWTQAIGAGLQVAGNLATTDTSQAMAAIYGGKPSDWSSGSVYGDAFTNIGKMDWSPVKNWWSSLGKGKLISAAGKNKEAAAQAEAMRGLG